METGQRFETQRLDHLGIVAGISQEIGLIEAIDQQVGLVQRKISCGQAVQAMVLNALGFSSRALYLMPDYLRNKPIELLIAPGLSAEDFNDDTLGRSLDGLYAAGVTELFAKIASQALKVHGIHRLVSTTGAGVRDEQDQPKLADHLLKGLLTLLAGEVLKDSAANVAVIRASNVDWTIVRYPRLIDGPLRGNYRVGYVGRDSGTQLSRADGAHFVLKELTGGKHIHQMPVVSY